MVGQTDQGKQCIPRSYADDCLHIVYLLMYTLEGINSVANFITAYEASQ